MIIAKFKEAGLITPPKWLDERSVTYLTITGSMAYAVKTESSDVDCVGFCMPPKDIVFPHLAGVIKGFGDQGEQFESWQQHHVKTQDGRQEYDFTVYSLVRYFDLCMENNPNMVDTLFTADNLVLVRTPVSDLVRANRHLFLHKGAWHKFKGYAFAQMKRFLGTGDQQKMTKVKRFMDDHKIEAKDVTASIELEVSRRECGRLDATGLDNLSPAEFEKYLALINDLTPRQIKTLEEGMDFKAAYHIVRLMLEVEQILTEGDLDLQRNKEVLKSIRRGEWSLDRLKTYFEEKELALEQVYLDSKLPFGPDERAIKALLFQCMEQHYGDLSTVVQQNTSVEDVLKDMRKLVAKHSG